MRLKGLYIAKFYKTSRAITHLVTSQSPDNQLLFLRLEELKGETLSDKSQRCRLTKETPITNIGKNHSSTNVNKSNLLAPLRKTKNNFEGLRLLLKKIKEYFRENLAELHLSCLNKYLQCPRHELDSQRRKCTTNILLNTSPNLKQSPRGTFRVFQIFLSKRATTKITYKAQYFQFKKATI